MAGYLLIILAFIASLLAAGLFFRPQGARRGRHLYYAAALCITAAALWLLYLIFTERFEFAYIFAYSSRNLPLLYKFSAFWAGQEGSLLLWALLHSLFGLAMIRRQVSGRALGVFSLLQVLLLSLILVKNPFMLLPESQTDGWGLNPLLQDPWMAIHPPLIFIGYAGLAVPYVLTIESLLSNNHQAWREKAPGWLLLAWIFLGSGIFIGSFWAYKVLGWGGYWGWDPVENASLVPWLAAGVAVHLLSLARRKTVAVGAAYFAVITMYLLVFYGAFITRSGILRDFSTHSFGEEGVGGLLGFYLLLLFAASFLLLIWRWPRLPGGHSVGQRGSAFALIAAAGTLSALAFLVFVGMSVPVFTWALGQAQNVHTDYYNKGTLPLALLIAFFLAIAVQGEAAARKRQWWLALAAGMTVVILGIYYGWNLSPSLVGMGLAAAAAAVNMVAAVGRGSSCPAALAHTGVALLIAGILASAVFSRSEQIFFRPGEAIRIFGKELCYLGREGSPEAKIMVYKFATDGDRARLDATTRYDAHGREAAREPAIYRGLAADIYIVPAANGGAEEGKEAQLARNEVVVFEDLTVKYLRLYLDGEMGTGNMNIRAQVEATRNGQTEQAAPELVYSPQVITPKPAYVFSDYEITLAAVYPGTGKIGLVVKNIRTAPLQAEVSHKPLVSLVWLGAITIVAGTSWAWAKKHRLPGKYTRFWIERRILRPNCRKI
ncbi:cytochrome c assembly protein [Thermosinus carboxydivorans Nor1]|uniref:Cytochrome c assembly protein n=1 Tax=Thermosinus carboxydivorans Nor1 TaxID=401526 RepID=A1HUH8_9FIRM|nr:cytochrome c biogenesis protein CcsA [Thermosinus carboxydivorans]EAX46319.1 cytochrome c assembly protein [Thermosinus carboxydivorans Nor1]